MAKEDLGLVEAPAPAALEMAGAANFWTMAAMGQAEPVPMPHMTAQQQQAMQRQFQAEAMKSGRRGHCESVPAPASTSARQTNRAMDTSADLSAYPYAPSIKMFMSFANGSFIGSAFIIGKRAVLTAGHCVYSHDAGGFATNIEYIPRFNNGAKPDGGYTAVKTTTLKEYVDLPVGPRYVFDIAASVVDKDFPTALGTAKYALNHLLPVGKLRSVGYPGQATPNFPFNGNQMWTSLGDYHNEDDGGFGTPSPRNYAHYNDMTGGCSGGPIYTDGATPFVVGLNSHVLTSGGQPQQPPRMFAPYFGDAVLRLIKWLKENGGEPNDPFVPGKKDDPINLKADLQTKVNELSTLIATMPG